MLVPPQSSLQQPLCTRRVVPGVAVHLQTDGDKSGDAVPTHSLDPSECISRLGWSSSPQMISVVSIESRIKRNILRCGLDAWIQVGFGKICSAVSLDEPVWELV